VSTEVTRHGDQMTLMGNPIGWQLVLEWTCWTVASTDSAGTTAA